MARTSQLHGADRRWMIIKNISALLKISTATRKQFCTDYLPVVSNIGPLTMTQAERQLSLSGLHLLLRPGHMLGFVSTPRQNSGY